MTSATMESKHVPSAPLVSRRVWVRPLGQSWRIRVDGEANGHRLLDELVSRGCPCSQFGSSTTTSDFFEFFCTSQPIHGGDRVDRILRSLDWVDLQTTPA